MALLSVGICLGLIYGIYAQCGKTIFYPYPRLASSYIVGGSHASPGDFPWQVGLAENGYLICGGTLVTGNDGTVKVITAAHCITGKVVRPYSVVFGMHSTSVTANRTTVPVVSMSVHPNYNSNTMTNDIAILHFGTLTLASLSNTHSHPICRPTRTYYSGEMSLVSGWGTTSEDRQIGKTPWRGGSSSNILQYVWKPVLDYTVCNTQTLNAGSLDSTMMCAGETNKDACQGDSGGPLVAYRNNAWELIGVVSWGFGCGRQNAPGVYCDTWSMRNWISANL